MNANDFLNSKKLQLILVILAIIIVSIPIYIGLTELLAVSITENDYDMDYTDDGLIVSQLSGVAIDEELSVNIKYDDGFERNESVILYGENDNTYLPLSEREDNYIESVDLYINESGEQILLSQLDSQLDDIEDFSISDFSISNPDATEISASDYISDTSMIMSYEWDFDDGIVLGGESISRDFTGAEEYDVVLTVTDKFGHTKSNSFTINIEDESTLLESKPSIQFEAGEELRLSGENSISNEDTDIISYSWDFDDGTTKEGEIVTHTFSEGGTYNVTLTAEDAEGNIHSEVIDVNVFSDIESEIQIANEDGFNYTFDASESVIDENVDDVTYEWNFGDGNTENTTEPVVDYTYEDANTYTVTLTIRGENDVTSVEEIEVTTVISIEFDDEMPYRVVDVNDDYEDVILPNNDLGDEWPEIVFVEDARYELINLPSEIELINEDETVVLSQRDTALYNNDNDVNWVDEDDRVAFTITQDLGQELFGYQTLE